MKYLKLFLFFLGFIISYLFPLAILLSESGTCTQGSTDEYFVSVVFCIIILLVFIPFVHLYYKAFIKFWWLSLFHIVSLISYIRVIPKYFYYTAIKGYGLCYGNKFWGDFSGNELSKSGFEAAHIEDKLFPVIFTAGIILILFYIIKIIIFRFKNEGAAIDGQ